MKKDWKYILYLSLAFGVFLLVKLTGPRQFDWTPTYAVEDKNPYGAFVLHELLPDIFKNKKINVSNLTLYELKDTLSKEENIIILTQYFRSDKPDTKALLHHAEKGGTVFIGAQSFSGDLADTLKLLTKDYLFETGIYEKQNDTSSIRFVNSGLDTTLRYKFKRENIYNYFSRFDTTRTTVISENEYHNPVIIRMNWGEGNIILTCIPIAFTNIYALQGNTNQFISTSLSYLPQRNIHWTQYYSLGRMEAGTPLRFILTREPLAWAYYITVLSILVFMIFEAKRKQRIIPIIKPLENTSLEFVGTIGTLYYQRSDHRNIAGKKITFFFDQVRTKFNLNPHPVTEIFISLLSRKTGKPENEIQTLFQLITRIQSQSSISEDQLIELNRLIEDFWKGL